MFTSILKFFGSLFSFFGKATDYANKKDTENLVRNNYEKDKEIDALREAQKTDELIHESEKRIDTLEQTAENVSSVDINDASLTDDEIKKELENLSESEKTNRENQISMSKEIKEELDKKQQEVKSNDSFNDGDEFIFKG